MSDLPETSENPSTSSHETPQLTQETGIGPDNINKDHLEQEMDNQISNSIDDQEREEAELSQNADNHNIDNHILSHNIMMITLFITLSCHFYIMAAWL